MRPKCWCCLFATVTLLATIHGLNAQAPTSATQDARGNQRLTTASLQRPVTLSLTGVRLEDALKAISEQAGVSLSYSRRIVPVDRRVTLRADGISAQAALERLLRGTNVSLFLSRSGQVSLGHQPISAAAESQHEPVTGMIVGRVIDARNGAGISGVSVMVEGTRLGAVTGNTGRYRIGNVPAGTHTVVVQQIGYAEARKSVAVTDGGEATADFAIDVSALPLDELVVTGTAFSTKVKAIPNPISVITARDVERKQATSVTELLRGEIPGVMALSERLYSNSDLIFVRGNASDGTRDLIKIYIDGVEVAHPTNLAMIDPKIIDRIEVVRGPQASVIYGSEAASGVLQIFTKKGHPGFERPRLDLQTSIGMIESDYTPADVGRPLTQDHSLALSGGSESFSYRAGASYGTAGEWIRHYGAETLSFSGGLRAEHGPLTAEITTLWSRHDSDSPQSSAFYSRYPVDACSPCGKPDYYLNRTSPNTQNTMGLTLEYRATSRWLHTLTLGDDQNRSSLHAPTPSYNTPADSFTIFQFLEYRRRSIRYHTAYEVEARSGVGGRFSMGVDYWNYDMQGTYAYNLLSAVGTVRPSSSTTSGWYNDSWWNVGYFGIAEVGFQDRFFLTLAARLEDNQKFGDEYGYATSPRAGVSYVHELGALEIKLRAQYGKSTRPPPPDARAGQVLSTSTYLPNPEIAPEEKVGWDAGVELYWGGRASIELTRFDEEANDLIYRVPLDLTPDARVYQYQNIGLVDVAGWELEGSLNTGPLTFQANYAYSDIAIQKVDEATAANPNANFQVGDRMPYSPKHSGGGRITARVGRGSVGVDWSVMAGSRGLDYISYYDYVYGGDPYRGSQRDYYVEYPALWRWNLSADHAMTERLTAFLRVNNLANDQDADFRNFENSPGRTTVVGVRWSF